MQLLVNALSCTNLSGRQVLCGHLGELVKVLPPASLHVLLHAGNQDLRGFFAGGSLVFHMAPDWTSHWAGRSLYESAVLPGLIRRLRVDSMLSLSGIFVPGLSCRQYTLALNPWPLLPGLHAGVPEKLKARLQRRGYRKAVACADGIGYGSHYMERLYHENAGRMPRCSAIVYPAFGGKEMEEMESVATEQWPRDPWTLVCVSLMARHKNIEALLKALALLRGKHGCPAKLRLVGGWSDQGYRQCIEGTIAELDLGDACVITGHLPRRELLRECARARVYGLLSRSESFGIPSVEAQWMGTPVVAASNCAAPEVCGDGGLYADADDLEKTAGHFARLLTDEAAWRMYSDQAKQNARRFQYHLTAKPLIKMLLNS